MSQMTFDQVYIKYRTQIERFLQRQHGCNEQDAQDITSEAFIVLHNKWDTIGTCDEDQIRSFLFRTAKNKSLELRRYQRKHPTPCNLESVSEQVSVDSMIYVDPKEEDKRYLDYIEQIKHKLDKKEFLTFEHLVINKQTPAQTAQELHISEINVRVRWCRIRKKLQKLLPEVFGK